MEELLHHIGAYGYNLKNIIHPISLVVNIIVCTLLSWVIAHFYIRYGNAVSNRRRFAANFVPLALTTMAIMMIVQPSVSLSLGLVGALSIIRFRAAIKDPEELTYLFLIIGVGLATGADQPLIAIIIISFVLLFLFLSKKVGKDSAFLDENRMYINITTDQNDIVVIEKILSGTLKQVALKRMDTINGGLDVSFMAKSTEVAQIQLVKDKLTALSDYTQVSIVTQPDLIV
jgi:uncharacterized membrane protein YhiD involved in acid resistance